MKNDYQNYRIFQGTLKALYPDATDIAFDEIGTTNVYIKAKQPYSSSGNGALFGFDADWNAGTDPVSSFSGLNECYETNDHPMEMEPFTESGLFPAIHNTSNNPQCTGGDFETLHNCLTAEPYSIGYFKVHFTPMIPIHRESTSDVIKTDVSVFPNPALTQFQLSPVNYSNGYEQNFKIKILSMDGKLIKNLTINSYQPVDITNLAAGIYQLIIYDEYGTRYFKQLIKSE